MVSVASPNRRGLRDWLIQRITAIVLAIYSVFILGYLIVSAPLNFNAWHALYSHELMRVFTFLVLLSLVYHTWIGLWTILTDYIKCAYLRLCLQAVVIVVLLGYVSWGIDILWGIK